MFIFLPASEQQLPIYPVTLGYLHDQRHIRRPNGTVFHHILYISEGEGYFYLNGSRVVLKQGTALFMRKDLPVEYGQVSETFRTSWVTFNGAFAEQIFDYFHVGGYAILHQKSIEARIAELCKLGERNALTEILSSETYALIIEFFTLFKKQNEAPVLERGKAFICENYRDDLSVVKIAKELHVSQSLLFKLFRTEENSSPMEYLCRVRIQKAKKMLLENEYKIYEVAKACGFSDAAYFCKVFKEKTEYSPASYRKHFMDC